MPKKTILTGKPNSIKLTAANLLVVHALGVRSPVTHALERELDMPRVRSIRSEGSGFPAHESSSRIQLARLNDCCHIHDFGRGKLYQCPQNRKEPAIYPRTR